MSAPTLLNQATRKHVASPIVGAAIPCPQLSKRMRELLATISAPSGKELQQPNGLGIAIAPSPLSKSPGRCPRPLQGANTMRGSILPVLIVLPLGTMQLSANQQIPPVQT